MVISRLPSSGRWDQAPAGAADRASLGACAWPTDSLKSCPV